MNTATSTPPTTHPLSQTLSTTDVDPMRITDAAFTPVDPSFLAQPMDALMFGSMALILIGLVAFMWGIQLYTGFLIPRRQQSLFGITPEAKAYHQQLQAAKIKEWEEAKKDPQMRALMKNNAITFLGISFCCFALLYALNSTDTEPLEQELTGATLVWDDHTYFERQSWKLNENLTVTDSNGTALGSWSVRSTGFAITLKDPSVRKINGLSGRQSPYERILLFKPHPTTGKWHSFDTQLVQNGSEKQYDRYEVARVLIKNPEKSAPVRPTFSSGLRDS